MDHLSMKNTIVLNFSLYCFPFSSISQQSRQLKRISGGCQLLQLMTWRIIHSRTIYYWEAIHVISGVKGCDLIYPSTVILLWEIWYSVQIEITFFRTGKYTAKPNIRVSRSAQSFYQHHISIVQSSQPCFSKWHYPPQTHVFYKEG